VALNAPFSVTPPPGPQSPELRVPATDVPSVENLPVKVSPFVSVIFRAPVASIVAVLQPLLGGTAVPCVSDAVVAQATKLQFVMRPEPLGVVNVKVPVNDQPISVEPLNVPQ
jgi:hypothetical protein